MKEVAGLGMLERGKFLVLTAEGDHPGAVVEVLGFTDDKIKVALIDLLDWFKPVDSLTTVEVPPSRLQFLTIEASIMEKGELLAEDANSDYIMPVVRKNQRNAAGAKSLQTGLSMLKEAIALNPLNYKSWSYLMNFCEFTHDEQSTATAMLNLVTSDVDPLYLMAGYRGCGNLPPVAEDPLMNAMMRVNLAGALGSQSAWAEEERQFRIIIENCVPAGIRCITLERMLATSLRRQNRLFEAAEVLRGQGRQRHLWNGFNGQSYTAAVSNAEAQVITTEFQKVSFGIWELANARSLEADRIYVAAGIKANTRASAEGYLEALSFLRKGMLYLDDEDPATLTLATRIFLKLNRHLMWLMVDTPVGSREMHTARGVPGNKEAEDRAVAQSKEMQRNPGKLPLLDLDPEFALLACNECYTSGSASTTKLAMCASCKRVAYCCRECQRAHWKRGHKAACQGE